MTRKERKTKDNLWKIITLSLLALVVFSRLYEVKIQRKGKQPSSQGRSLGEEVAIAGQNLTLEEEQAIQAFLKFKKVKAEAIPFGVPDVYGSELAVNFDEVQESMNIMRVFGPTYGTDEEKITLTGDELERFIKIGEQTSCEYCCGVTTLVDEKGEAACGCAHSIVMRGLAAYLIKNHSDKFTDKQILDEINEWKKTFFPKQTLAVRFDEMKAAGDETIESLLQEFPDFLPQMVGGC